MNRYINGIELNEKEFADFFRMYTDFTRKHIEDNKWYLSEKEGYDVGENTAAFDYIKNHSEAEANEIKQICLERILAGRIR